MVAPTCAPVQRRLAERSYDVLYVKRCGWPSTASPLTDCPAVLDLTDSMERFYDLARRRASLKTKALFWEEWIKHRWYEPRVAAQFDTLRCLLAGRRGLPPGALRASQRTGRSERGRHGVFPPAPGGRGARDLPAERPDGQAGQRRRGAPPEPRDLASRSRPGAYRSPAAGRSEARRQRAPPGRTRRYRGRRRGAGPARRDRTGNGNRCPAARSAPAPRTRSSSRWRWPAPS